MKLFSRIAEELLPYQRMLSNIQDGHTPMLILGASEIHKAHFISSAVCSLSRPILLITPDEASSRAVSEAINAMDGNKIAFVYPERDFTLRSGEMPSREYEQIRLGVLARILRKECKVVCASVGAVLQHTVPPRELLNRTFSIDRSGSYSIETLQKKLLHSGYESRPQVEGTAQFSVRGGIIDIFSPNHNTPVRIELWGDSVDTMAHFDLQTQRRTDEIESIHITPAAEVLYEDRNTFRGALESLCKKTKNEKAKRCFSEDLSKIESGVILNSLDKYYSLVYPSPATLFDYLKDPVVFISEYQSCKDRAKSYLWQEQEDQKQLLSDGELTRPLIVFDESMPSLHNLIKDHPAVYIDTFAHTNSDVAMKDVVSLSSIQTSNFSGEVKLLKEDVLPLLEEGYAVYLLAGTAKAAAALSHDLKQASLPVLSQKDTDTIAYQKISVLPCALPNGFAYPEQKISVIASGRSAAPIKRRRIKQGRQLTDLTELHEGDLVVHASHGIGVFSGIQKLDMQGIVKDYIKISYAGSDILYVPVTQLDLVAKYIGAKENGRVKLNSLHSGEWQKTRQRAKKAADDIADELIKLYAARMEAPGFAFSKDTDWQREFEERFPYIETDDQLKCVEEIKADMEQNHPMDRLLCGDVGFGKTEVAMRACFKCVMDGRQCAVLCPTTILAWQHYQTFTKRFEGFPIHVELLSRFRTPKEQKQIIEKLTDGTVDIVIGTHRLVQKDVQFKNLGFAVVDEEQRFGVKHKEQFKKMFTGIDMLTLSATPIPRTLNMAVSGIRDMSTIEQPPQDRYPVQSYVLEYDPSILTDAIRKELRRGGQVYYVHNRVESIEACAAKIHNAVPEARIAVAHGKMAEQELSEIWRQLLEHEIDILVCTTIIETGVDVANCNTLIIENADCMGLSQLYQLRGRVGRSTRRAFAYFTFVRGKTLSEISTKRLTAIREFTRFGSGFHIAMRDLEIRGAGNLLGSQQHGHMEAVGYDMYLKLLSDAVAEKKGEHPKAQDCECKIDLRLSAHIPEEYIENTAQRIDIYKKIAAVHSEEERQDVVDELIDRFGDPPEAVLSLLDVAFLRNTLASHGFEEINERPQGLLLYPHTLNMDVSNALVKGFKGRVMVNASSRPYFIVKPEKGQKPDVVKELREVVSVLEKAAPAT